MGSFKFSILSLLFSIIFLFLVSVKESVQIPFAKERVSLLSFKSGVVSDPQGVLESWNSSNLDICKWSRVKCDNVSNQIFQLDLSDLSLRGRISPSLANLSSLKILDLSKNFFEGSVPAELGNLSQLQQLSLSWNLLQGKIPYELGYLTQLVYLDLASNNFVGEIPSPIFCNGSSSLEYIDLSNNSLSGEIPLKNGCELKELKFLLLWSNKLVGHVPLALSNSSKLKWIDLESNMLSGELPSQIVQKMPQLQFLYLSYNSFVSHNNNTNLEPFLTSLVNSSNLTELELAGNNLGGRIPPIIGNLSALVQIHLDENLLFGAIPPQISNLVNLTLLNLSSNLLNGTIPREICRLGKLERVYLSNNSLFGEIPSALGNISHLGLLDLSKNELSGSIPDSFANLSQLRRLFLYENHLSGTLPPSLGKCINLEILDLSHNQISGSIPNEVAALRSLKLYLNLSSNHLQGPLPLELSKMDMVLAIDLSSNNFSSTIPPQLGSCIALEYLNLSSNTLEGTLPSSIGRLPYLKQLDVSLNQLGGEIPESLQSSPTLKYLNFSFNKFVGNVSKNGAFSSLTMDSFLGNKGICGTIKGMKKLFRSKFKRKLAIFNQGNLDDEEKESKELKYRRISYQQLIEATGGFSASALVGSGRFGNVYKGVLEDNTRIAVKVLDSKTAKEISGSFKRECQVLKRARHRNLIRIITICSKPDFKALVLPLMSNGSLERYLYPSHGLSAKLNLIQLVSICSDVAEGIAYLHHYSPVRVVHCDLKPSNILLDDDMTALVTDFGIARLLKGIDENNATSNANDSVSFSSTDGLLCGSVGYIAPEYGIGRRVSTQGDVYSYGILLLEIIVGKRPTDVLFQEGSSLHEWVKSHYPRKLEPIVEEAMVRFAPLAISGYCNKIWSEVIVELIELGLMCTQYNPSTRPTMLDVANEMGRLKQFLSNPPSLLIQEASPNKFGAS
ncbi:hypothetical protein JCGZ_04065 [Jatropha curcas]|uniref:non-specific serine/threonine protein kinase n=1 Tax=Jatropha curcas TaxID=180498 RepID=A0A067KRJ4_JATCU|nr:hypothetical protein JCGZ_04065 [Jatropha curcas]